MRTTLDLDPDVLKAAKELAQRQRKTTDQIVSQLLRQALNQNQSSSIFEDAGSYGFRPFPSQGGVVTNSLIDELRGKFGD